MSVERLLIGVLATWRLTAMLYYEKGPFDVFCKLRAWAQKHSAFLGGLLECFWCLSVWTGTVVFVLAVTPLWWLLGPLALSAGAVLLSRGGDTIYDQMESCDGES